MWCVLTELEICLKISVKLKSSLEKPSGKYHRTHNVHTLYCWFFFPITGESGGTVGQNLGAHYINQNISLKCPLDNGTRSICFAQKVNSLTIIFSENWICQKNQWIFKTKLSYLFNFLACQHCARNWFVMLSGKTSV